MFPTGLQKDPESREVYVDLILALGVSGVDARSEQANVFLPLDSLWTLRLVGQQLWSY